MVSILMDLADTKSVKSVQSVSYGFKIMAIM